MPGPVPPASVKLEICVDTPEGLATAIAAGADRIELCSGLDLGGLTPTPGLIALASASPVPVYAMIRPRAGDFVFGAADRASMHADILAVRSAGLAGVVLGASRPDRRLDEDMLAGLCAAAVGLGLTLHRAFDLAPDLPEAMEAAIRLGFERILTSGGALDAQGGGAGLAALVTAARNRIAIMAGSGIRPDNVRRIVEATGVREIHASARRLAPNAPDLSAWGFGAAGMRETDAATIASLRAELSREDASLRA